MSLRNNEGAGNLGLTGQEISQLIAKEITSLPLANTAAVRAVRKSWSASLKSLPPESVLEIAASLVNEFDQWWVAYEIVRFHPATFQNLDEAKVEQLGSGIEGWKEVDSFARTVSGPAWLRGFVDDELIEKWALDSDVWRRRAALVSTVALNMQSQGGRGDVPRTLAICEILVDDHEDTIEKALSWALRELIPHDPKAVDAFLAQHDEQLGARVKRETRNKLETGLKNPGKS